ncbi:unnamed protein product [Trichobilharzia regenti]|nr:unnamed protein product [Trichobilharzia regenti]
MPIKWSAEKVWRVEHSGRSREKEEASIWKGQSHSPRENYSKSTSHERDVRPGLNDQRRVEKRSHITESPNCVDPNYVFMRSSCLCCNEAVTTFKHSLNFTRLPCFPTILTVVKFQYITCLKVHSRL